MSEKHTEPLFVSVADQQDVVTEGGELVATFFTMCSLNGEVESIANARLFASAPDLLAALKPFVALCSSEEAITITVYSEDVKAARKAIARAEGRTS